MSLQRDSGLASRTDMAVLKAYIVSDSPILHVRVGRIEHVLTLFLPWRVFDGHRDIDIRLERRPTTLKVSLEREGEANLLSTQPFRSVPFQVEFQDTAEVPSSSYRLCCRFETEPRQGRFVQSDGDAYNSRNESRMSRINSSCQRRLGNELAVLTAYI